MVVQRKKAEAATAATSTARGDAKGEPVASQSGSVEADRIDVYIRMNMDCEKDYCFNVPAKEPVSFLYTIFEQLPIQLNPGYFFHSQPEGLSVSVHPGYLTAEGALLFTTDAMKQKWLKHLPNDALIGDVVAEGQLIIPEWKPHTRHEMSVILFLLTWLYLDLPEYISPTPGTAPSIWLYRLVSQFVQTPHEPVAEQSLFNGKWWQLGFFTLHIVKLIFIYFILWNGAWNPTTLNPLKRIAERQKEVPLLSREDLGKMGWTGARRLAKEDWPEKYRNYRTERAGGLLEAYRAGLLEKPIGIVLHEGEGWNVLAGEKSVKKLSSIKVDPNLLDAEGKFVVSPAYLKALAEPLAQMVQESSSEDVTLQNVKNFRSYGYLDGPKPLVEMFDLLIETHRD